MLLLNSFFNHESLIAFTTDSTRDYTLQESRPYMTAQERSLLEAPFSVTFDRFAWARQVHGDRVLVVDEEFLGRNALDDADALVTNLKNVLIAVRTADCLPVFLWDPEHGAMGVVHAGWKSTYKKILHRAIEAMNGNFQTNAGELKVAFGPVIRPCCYQVGPEFK
ncbi:MAG: polyphenol oxidase family protein, partial [Candidatus Omnitrophica bacterium]|nr:polyphenol oxidase family protein [Candidatus Omnitrophota bacterium]